MDDATLQWLNDHVNVYVWYRKLIELCAWFEIACLPVLGVCFLLQARLALQGRGTAVYWGFFERAWCVWLAARAFSFEDLLLPLWPSPTPCIYRGASFASLLLYFRGRWLLPVLQDAVHRQGGVVQPRDAYFSQRRQDRFLVVEAVARAFLWCVLGATGTAFFCRVVLLRALYELFHLPFWFCGVVDAEAGGPNVVTTVLRATVQHPWAQIAFDTFYACRLAYALIAHWETRQMFSMVLCVVAVTIECGGRARMVRALAAYDLARRRTRGRKD